MDSDVPFLRDRHAAFDDIIAFALQKASLLQPKIILRIDLASPTIAAEAAEREIWQMFARGLMHLKSGGIDGAPGMMSRALSMVSLRSSSLAQVLGVQSPEFEPVFHTVDYDSGRAAAYAEAGTLAEAIIPDIDKSIHIMQRKIFDSDLSLIYGGMGDDFNPAQADIAKAVAEMSGVDITLPEHNPHVTENQIDIIRRQMVMTLERLEDASHKIIKEIIWLSKNPPEPQSRKQPGSDPSDFTI